jgi:hypothetical protein
MSAKLRFDVHEDSISMLAPALLATLQHEIYLLLFKPTTISDGYSSISYYSFASDDLVFCPTQAVILATKASTSSLVLPACKHTRIRSEPSGTVGGTIGLTTKFFS